MTGDLLTAVWRWPDRRPQWTPAQWEAALGQARRSRLLGRLAWHHVARHWFDDMPEQPRRVLQGALRLIERQHREVEWEVACILRALRGVATPVVMLKGAAYFVAKLPPRHGRLFADIDLLVVQDRLAEVEGALLRAGWISEERDAYNQRYYRDWMHEIPPLKHVVRGTVIDVHHTITPPTSRFRIDASQLLRKLTPVEGRERLFVLAPEDMVLHSAVHLFQDGQFDHGLRDLLDLDDLLRHFADGSPRFWSDLFDRARELGLGQPLCHALDHVEERFGQRVPLEHGAARHAARPRGWIQRRLTGAFRLALDPHHPSSERRFSSVARNVLYIRAHSLRMPLRLAVPHLLRKAYMRRFPKEEPVAKP